MFPRKWRVSGPLEILGVVLVLSGLASAGVSGWPFGLILAGVVVTVMAALVRRRTVGPSQSGDGTATSSTADERTRLRTQAEEIENLKSVMLRSFAEREARIAERENNLAERSARLQELLDYPTADVHQDLSQRELARLTEQDRAVRELLEVEAERVYEKIRANGYSKGGSVDVDAIRKEGHDLIVRIARIYAPQSSQPLMETSFEQLARAASRICLHMLVLLEQLPLNVQQYNLNSLHGYFRKAVVGYGAFQKAAPWFRTLSRGVYAGRMASMTNPLSLGAWWLASELGRKGTQKLVENVIDRQAVSVLHDVVTVIGVEVACIYGTGFRQRDPAWILGTELVELVRHFPLSRESLRAGLRAVTALPLRNEYDRIYLYRCLANHRSAGHLLTDAAMLTRAERETIAKQLEEFYAAHIHGATPESAGKWRNSFEERFDLRLKLSDSGRTAVGSQSAFAAEAVRSLVTFMRSVANMPMEAVATHLPLTRSWQLIDSPERPELLARIREAATNERFSPPGLDPGSPVTEAFLADLATVAVRYCSAEPQIEQLVVEAGSYFRRTVAESQRLVDAQWMDELRSHCIEPDLHPELNSAIARRILQSRQPSEQVGFCYPDVMIRFSNGETRAVKDAWLAGFRCLQTHQRRTQLLPADDRPDSFWHHEGRLDVVRDRGLLIDSAVISGGHWHPSAVSHAKIDSAAPQALVVSGSLRGGRFRNYFRPLLSFAE